MTMAVYWIAKIVLVVVLLGGAAAIATPKGRLPLALRGLARILNRDRGRPDDAAASGRVPASVAKRTLAFVMVLLALLVVMI